MKKDYTAQDVLVGMFNFFPEYFSWYEDKGNNFNEFFFERREDYSVLDNVAFDSDGIFPESKELRKGFGALRATELLSYVLGMPGRRVLNLSAIKTAFEKYSKNKFSGKELNELEELSSEFRRVFR